MAQAAAGLPLRPSASGAADAPRGPVRGQSPTAPDPARDPASAADLDRCGCSRRQRLALGHQDQPVRLAKSAGPLTDAATGQSRQQPSHRADCRGQDERRQCRRGDPQHPAPQGGGHSTERAHHGQAHHRCGAVVTPTTPPETPQQGFCVGHDNQQQHDSDDTDEGDEGERVAWTPKSSVTVPPGPESFRAAVRLPPTM